MMKKFTAFLLALAVMLSMTACGGSGEKEETAGDGPFKIRVGTMPYYSGVPIQVIQDEGLDKKYGFEMKVLNFASGGPMAEALGAGEWDVGPIGAGGMIAIPNYNAYLIYDVEHEMDGAWIMARPDSAIAKAGSNVEGYPDVLGDADSVKGITVLGTIGNISHYMAIDYVEKMGLTMNDVNFLNMETSNVYTAFVSGSGDLACMGSPTAAMKLMDEGYVRVGGLLQQGLPQQDCMLISEDYYKNHHDEAAAFMAAWLEASAMLNADQEYEQEMMSKFYSTQGRTDFTDADVEREASWNTYMDPTNYDPELLGSWMQGLISCYVDAGVQEASVHEALVKNTVKDIMEDALEIYQQKQAS